MHLHSLFAKARIAALALATMLTLGAAPSFADTAMVMPPSTAARLAFPATVDSVHPAGAVTLKLNNGQLITLDMAYILPMTADGHPLLLSSLAPGQQILVSSPAFPGGAVVCDSSTQIVFLDANGNKCASAAMTTAQATAP